MFLIYFLLDLQLLIYFVLLGCARCTNFSNCKDVRFTFKGKCPETKSSAK